MKTRIVIVRKQHTGQRTSDIVDDVMKAISKAEKYYELIDEAWVVISDEEN